MTKKEFKRKLGQAVCNITLMLAISSVYAFMLVYYLIH